MKERHWCGNCQKWVDPLITTNGNEGERQAYCLRCGTLMFYDYIVDLNELNLTP